MDNYKIKVKDEAESKEAQELFFELGYVWADTKCQTPMKFTTSCIYSGFEDGELCRDDYDENPNHQQITLPELRILAAAKQTQSPSLISGAEALRALADGKEVELKNIFDSSDWMLIDLSETSYELDTFLVFEISNRYEFRLKPQTIKVELVLPKPFEPKEGDIYWFITCRTGKGYSCRNHKARHGDSGMQFGAYRTEEEIKQVVEQLRKIRGTNS